MSIVSQFETYQPATIQPNRVTQPSVFNGMCLIRRYQVTVEELPEPKEVLIARLRELWDSKGTSHSANQGAMIAEAKRLGITLGEPR